MFCLIFATVDSFTYSVGKPSRTSSDFFNGIVKSMSDGELKVPRSGKIQYAGQTPLINKETCVIIDETRDLPRLYGEAFLMLVKKTSTNLYVVGDILQSLSNEDNALTFLRMADALTFLRMADAQNMRVTGFEPMNVVRRFSDPRLIRFVNDMVPFARYGLPVMTSASTGTVVTTGSPTTGSPI